jgi:hypothetical protein
LFESANKISQFRDYPIGVMTWALGAIADRTVQSLIMECEYSYPRMDDNEQFQVHQVAQDLVSFIRQRYDAAFPDPANRPPLGLAIGGHSHNQFFAEQYKYEFPGTALEPVRPNKPNGNPTFGVNWFGLVDALVRLVKGFDPASLNALVNLGVPQSTIQQWLASGVAELPLVFDGMPLKDAIDFAEYCARVVIGRWRFAAGPNLCGGDVDIAVMRPHSFQWAKRKQWAVKVYEEKQ